MLGNVTTHCVVNGCGISAGISLLAKTLKVNYFEKLAKKLCTPDISTICRLSP